MTRLHCIFRFEMEHLLILGRCTSGRGGSLILDGAMEVLETEYPELAAEFERRMAGDLLRRYGSESDDPDALRDPHRDAMTLPIARHALQTGVPLFAICRGFQELNVALGGTLIEDIPSEIGSTDHSITGPEVVDCHQTVIIESDSLVAKAIGSTEVCVNSIHHQAVRRVAPGMRAAGWTEDGIVEVLDPEDHQWPLLAVQWHPEYLAVKDDAASLALFSALVENARIKAGSAS